MPWSAHAQYSVDYSRVYGGSDIDEGASVDVDDRSGFVAVGGRSFSSDLYLHQNNGGSDYWIMEMTPQGDTIWSRTYGGSDNDDISTLHFLNDGSIAAFGTTWSDNSGDVPGHVGQIGAWLVTTDAVGNIDLSVVYSGILGEEGIDMEPLTGGGFALLVQSTSPMLEGEMNHGNFDFWVARVNAFGGVVWSHFFGGLESDYPAKIVRINGGLIVVGSTASTDGDVTQNAGGFDYWVLRLDLTGSLIWERTFGGTGDDIAHDAVLMSDGSILITGASNSTDGDRSMAFGGDDVWLVNIDQDGNLIWEKSYGGTDDDEGMRITRAGNSQVAFAAQSKSHDGDLNGNKGRQDVWISYIDHSGQIQQQMNYGGTLDDYGNGLFADPDSVVYMVGFSASDNGNLPYPGYPMKDLWLMRMSVDTVPCESNNHCFPYDQVSFAVLRPETNGAVVCINGCNAGADKGPAGPPGCTNFYGAAAWFKVKTDSNAEVMSIGVSTPEFNIPQILVLQGFNCMNFHPVNCDIGSEGELTIVNMPVDPDTSYYVIVGDGTGLEGAFDLCVNVLDINFCNRDPKLYVAQTSMGSALSGPFLPGENVEICYEVNAWDKIDCNGLQGILPTFGPGWDSLSFNSAGRPVHIDTMLEAIHPNGEWNWWPLGTVHYNFTNPVFGYTGGQTLPTGWYFVNFDDPPPNDTPDESIGDLNSCNNDTSRWKVCFTLQTKSECEQNLDCSVTMKTFADGEIGANVSQSCQNDPPLKINRYLNCCINPMISPIPDFTICSGDSVIITLQSTLNPPVTYTWGVNVSGNVIGAMAGVSNTLIFQQLTNVGNSAATVTYTVKGAVQQCETPFEDFTVTVLPQPTGNMTLVGPSLICRDEGAQVRFDFVGNGPFIAEYSINGVLRPPILSEDASTTISIPLTENALISFTDFVDQLCQGHPNGAFLVTVLQPGETTIDTAVCQGDSVHVGGHVVGFPGNYQFTLDNAAENGCDSIITLNLDVYRKYSMGREEHICEGDSLVVGQHAYTETGFYTDTLSTVNGCDSVINLLLTVSNEITDERSAVICAGSSLDFHGHPVFQDGTYYDTVAINGSCDSIYILHLNVLNVIVLVQTVITPDTGQNSGAILIQVSGGIPPFSYSWSTGDTTNNPMNLAAGNYTLTVTDELGCTGEFSFFLVSETQDLLPGFTGINVYPNPLLQGEDTHVVVSRVTPAEQAITIQLYNAQGMLLQNFRTVLREEEDYILIGNQGFPGGVYFIRLTDDASGNSSVRRYILE